MKKLILTVGFFFLMTGGAVAASSVTVTGDIITADKTVRILTIACVGNISNTNLTIATVAMAEPLIGWYPWRVIVENLAATTVTGDSDVYLKDSGDRDLLGDAGKDQLDNTTRNYLDITSGDPIIDIPYLDVDNQAEADGAYTVTIIFVK